MALKKTVASLLSLCLIISLCEGRPSNQPVIGVLLKVSYPGVPIGEWCEILPKIHVIQRCCDNLLPYTWHTKLQRFLEKCCCKNRSQHRKLLKKFLQLWKKVVVWMEDNCIFCSFVGSVRGPWDITGISCFWIFEVACLQYVHSRPCQISKTYSIWYQSL